MSQRVFALRKADAARVDLYVKVTPQADRDVVGKVERQADDTLRLCVRVRAVPDGGAANTAVIKVLAKHFGVPKSSLQIVLGMTSRLKTVTMPDSDELRASLEQLI